jgi:hypothetical protein
MKLIRTFLGFALVAVSAVTADAAVTLRTAPADPPLGGFAQCLVTNGGSGLAPATLSMFSFVGNLIIAQNLGVDVGPNQSRFGTRVSTTGSDVGENPSWCECIVPNKDFRCSFTVVSDINVTVVPAQ